MYVDVGFYGTKSTQHFLFVMAPLLLYQLSCDPTIWALRCHPSPPDCQAWNYQLPQLCVGATQSSIDKTNTHTHTQTLQNPPKKKQSTKYTTVLFDLIISFFFEQKVWVWPFVCDLYTGMYLFAAQAVLFHWQRHRNHHGSKARFGWVEKIRESSESSSMLTFSPTGSRYRKRWAFTPFWTWPGGMNGIFVGQTGGDNILFMFLIGESKCPLFFFFFLFFFWLLPLSFFSLSRYNMHARARTQTGSTSTWVSWGFRLPSTFLCEPVFWPPMSLSLTSKTGPKAS